jgi:hypothetical protein
MDFKLKNKNLELGISDSVIPLVESYQSVKLTKEELKITLK